MFKWLMGWLEPLRDREVYPPPPPRKHVRPGDGFIWVPHVPAVGHDHHHHHVSDCTPDVSVHCDAPSDGGGSFD